MASVSGTSVLPGQRVIGPGAITVANFDIIFPGLNPNQPQRLGYGWILVKPTATATPRRVLARGPIYAPGIYYAFPSVFGFSGTQYEWWIEWDRPGISWTASFN